MEAFIESFKAAARELWPQAVPYLRQAIRFLALPYCYFFQINWQECTRSRREVAGDLLYIFFVLGYYPDNYGLCRLFERDRSSWRLYYGSSFNPFQKARLAANLIPPRFQVLFENKEVCHQLCAGLGVRVPRLVGVLPPTQSFAEFIALRQSESLPGRLFLKPVSGAAGAGIFEARRHEQTWTLVSAKGKSVDELGARKVRYLVEEVVAQHEALAAIYPHSVNTMRIMTMLKSDGTPYVMGSTIRFGAGGNRVDNWSVGGVALGLDLRTGRLTPEGLGKSGQRVDRHPDTGFKFADFLLPEKDGVREFGESVQARFPYFGMLGLDVAVTPEGPLLIEINAFPDIVGFEQGWGPLFSDPVLLREFDRLDLLTHSMRRVLAADLAELEDAG